MLRRLRLFILATGTTLCVLIALAFVVSAWWNLQIGIRGGPVITIFAGSLDVWWADDVSWFIDYKPHGRGLQYTLFEVTWVYSPRL